MDENKKSKTAEILEQLSAGVQSVYESDAWKHYLSFVAVLVTTTGRLVRESTEILWKYAS